MYDISCRAENCNIHSIHRLRPIGVDVVVMVGDALVVAESDLVRGVKLKSSSSSSSSSEYELFPNT